MSISAPRTRTHECPLPYPWLFTDEVYGRRDTLDPDSYDPPGRSVAIDHPRYEDGRLLMCPECETWWVFRTHPTYPTPSHLIGKVGMVQCVTTYSPAWHRVRWSDFGLRKRIRQAEETDTVGWFPPEPVQPAPHVLDESPRFF